MTQKQELPKVIFGINYAGFWVLQVSQFYEQKGDLLNQENYENAPEFVTELTKRWNCHDELVEALRISLQRLNDLQEIFTADNFTDRYDDADSNYTVIHIIKAALAKTESINQP